MLGLDLLTLYIVNSEATGTIICRFIEGFCYFKSVRLKKILFTELVYILHWEWKICVLQFNTVVLNFTL